MTWTPADFLAAGLLISAALVAWMVLRRRIRHPFWRRAGTMLILVLLLLVWAELAVGLLR